jgi:uncharacterized membrane protein
MNERQSKKEQFEAPKKRGALTWIVVAAVLLVAVAVAGWTAVGGGKGGKYPLVTAEQGRIVIPVAQVSDGKAHFFSYRTGAGTVDFFVLRSRDGVIRAALDTCDVCYEARKGYRQEGDAMVCNNCDQKFDSVQINEVKGGCNPAPLGRRVEGERIVIAAAELEQGAKYFQVQ